MFKILKNKKGQGLSITTIVVAAVAVVVLVVLIAIFTGRLGAFTGALRSASAEKTKDAALSNCIPSDIYYRTLDTAENAYNKNPTGKTKTFNYVTSTDVSSNTDNSVIVDTARKDKNSALSSCRNKVEGGCTRDDTCQWVAT